MKFRDFVPIIGHGIDAIASGLGSIFNANQAKKNRQFQERMYEKQKEDTIAFWKMQNEYDLPSAQYQRILDSPLNPLLLYGEGGNVATSSGQLNQPTAPHGAQASGGFHTNFGQGIKEAMLLDAQIDNLRADSEQKRADAGVKGTQIDWYETSKSLELGIKQRNYEKLDYEMEKIASESHALDNVSAAQVAMISASIDMLQKRYELDSEMQDALIWYNVEDIAVRNRQVDATLKSIAVQMYEAETNRMDVIAKVKKVDAEIEKIYADTAKTDAEKELLIEDIIKKELDIEIKGVAGADNINGTAAALLLLTGAASGRDRDLQKAAMKRYKELKKEFSSKKN